MQQGDVVLSAILERFQTSAGRLLQQHVNLVLLGHIHLPRVHQSANSAMLESMLGRDGRLPARRVGQERLLLCPQQPVSIVRLERTLLRHQLRAEIVWRASTHRRPHPALAHRAVQENTQAPVPSLCARFCACAMLAPGSCSSIWYSKRLQLDVGINWCQS